VIFQIWFFEFLFSFLSVFFVMSVKKILFHGAEFTKYVVTPAIGVSGVGIAMAAYGAFDGIVSIEME